MPRRKKPKHEPNPFERAAADLSRPSYNREAGRILFGEHDEQVSIVVPGVDANGNLVAHGYEMDVVPDRCLVRWVDALTDFDDPEHRDKAPLVAELLDSNLELLPVASGWLADLLGRYRLKKKQSLSAATSYERKVLALLTVLDDLPDAWSRLSDLMSQRIRLAAMIERFDFISPSHRPRVPAYDLSSAEVLLHRATELVRNLRSTGSTLDEAIAAAATKYNADPELIRNHHGGRRGATRRIKARNTRP
ncbi:MAG: hypothetical protein ACXWCQ_34895 [Burkholderiales bacterium]